MLQNKPYDVLNGTPFTKFEGLPGANLYLVHTKGEFDSFFEMLMSKKLVACDTETSGFQYFLTDRIVGMSFGWGDDNFYIPVRHVDSALGGEQPAQLDIDYVRPFLQKFFSRTDVQTIWANGKFDKHFYKADDIDILTPFHDTTILWQFYDENAPAALKVIASGWTDELGRKQKGLIGPEAAEFEKELDKWRAEEAKERRRLFSQSVIKETENRAYDIKYQGIKRAALKKQVKEEMLLTHQYAKAKKEDVHYGCVPIDLMTKYAATDTFLTWAVFKFVIENVEFNDKLKALYKNELELNTELFLTEEGGIKVDRKYLESLRVKLKEDYVNKKREILKILDPTYRDPALAVSVSGSSEWDVLDEEKPKDMLSVVEEDLDKDTSLNLNSTDQLAIALQAQGVELTKRTESGKLQLDKKILSKLAKAHPVIQTILDLRAIVKKQNTYVEGILEKLTADDYLHASFNQNVSTGRMSSNSPNLQNISGKDSDIRAAFIPENDYIFLFCDYSQIEVRLTAHYSKDPLLLDAYKNEQDVHTRTMCEMFGHNYEEVEKVLAEQDTNNPDYAMYKMRRNIAKIINFSIIYGSGANGLSEQVKRPDQYANLSDEEWVGVCQGFIDNYLDKYRGVRRFINISQKLVSKQCYLTNQFGRVRHLPHAQATTILQDRTQFWREARAQRQGTNFLIQSEAADIFKTAVVRVGKLLREGNHKSRIVNFVHDEIQIYLHKDELFLVNQIKKAMEDFDYAVPIIADIEFSTTNWANKKEIH